MNKYLTVFLIFLLLFTACDDWFDAPSKGSDIDEERLFSDEDSFLNALAGIYTQLRSNALYGEHLSVSTLEFLAQNYIPDNDQTRSLTDYDYSTPENRSIIRNIWLEMYNAIAACNKTLEHILSTDIKFNFEGQKEIITGELYALRGTLHFELLRMFHPSPATDPGFKGMPYMTSFGNAVSPVLSTTELLQLITEDLLEATRLLYRRDPLFDGSNSIFSQPGKIDRKLRTFHLNYYAVTAELARIYLYEGNYREAYRWADSTFNHLRTIAPAYQIFYYYGPGKYNSDKSFSREHLFGIASGPEGLTEVAENLFETRRIRVCQNFTELYPYVKDTRYRDWFKMTEDVPAGFILSEKFSRESLLSGYTSTAEGDKELPVRIPFIKLGEVSLIAAEALNESGQTSEAAGWIIELQNYRDISPVKKLYDNNTLTQDALRQEIRAEYRREFYGEGQLFFFYKRMNDKQLLRYDGSMTNMPAGNYTFPIPEES